MLMADRYRCAQPIVNSTVLPERGAVTSIERALSLSIFRNCNAVMQSTRDRTRQVGCKRLLHRGGGKMVQVTRKGDNFDDFESSSRKSNFSELH